MQLVRAKCSVCVTKGLVIAVVFALAALAAFFATPELSVAYETGAHGTDAHDKAHGSAGHGAGEPGLHDGAHGDEPHADAGGHGGHHAAGVSSLLFPVINFVLYVLVLRVAFKKTVAPALRERSLQAEAELTKAARMLEEANQRYEDLSYRLETIASEEAELKEQLRVEGERVGQNIIEKAHEQVHSIGEETERRIESERDKAAAEIRREVVLVATNLARKKLAAELSESDDQRLRQVALRGML